MSDESPKTRVLVVDDDQTLLDMYKERLVASGYDVITASDGRQALAKAIDYLPHCILLDVLMPQVNGFDVLENIRSTEETKNIPVIMLTALVQDSNRQKGLAEGADDYIIKSETMPGEVIAKIENVIKKRKESLQQNAG
jgi:DNA-binding response OmpR family regulator